MLLKLQTLKGKTFEDHIKVIDSIIIQEQLFGRKVRSFLEEQTEKSVFLLRESAVDRKLATIAIIIIILADIATIPDQETRRPFSRIVDEVCAFFGIDKFDISLFSQYTSTFEDIICDIPISQK